MSVVLTDIRLRRIYLDDLTIAVEGANFAREGIARVVVPMAAIPGLVLTADYRLVGIRKTSDLNSAFYNKVNNVVACGRIGLQRDIVVHLLTIGTANGVREVQNRRDEIILK